MKGVIIGTAGHVDHGKTALVKALTGTDTDRLQEEKKRGITIELGFARLDFGGGNYAGVIDVPGHERFIRNMLAGAGGIDLAMLVVAADEGVMPQTAEHLNILSLLGIEKGLIAVTKTDLIQDEQWLELVREDIEELVRGSFLQEAPIIPVSAYTGQGIAQLKQSLRALTLELQKKNTGIPFRLPVDRVFPVDGFGTVVTGTMIEGQVKVGQVAELLPSGIPVTVRSIQVHGTSEESAFAGQRVAMNLAGVKLSSVSRGEVVAARATVRCSVLLDVRLNLLRDSGRTIKNSSSVHVYHGTRTVLAKVTLLDRDELMPGESCFAQLRLQESLPCKSADRFVVRFYSPLETIGGGIILDSSPEKRRRHDPLALEALTVRECGSAGERIHQAAVKDGPMPDADSIRFGLNMDDAEFESGIRDLINKGLLFELLPGRYIADTVLDCFGRNCQRLLAQYHDLYPLQRGQRVAELRQKLFGKCELAVGNAVLDRLCRDGSIVMVNGTVSLPEFEIKLTVRQKSIREKVLRLYLGAGYDTPPPEEILGMYAGGEKNDCAQVIEHLVSEGEIIALSPSILWHRKAFEKALNAAREHFNKNDCLAMPEYRDILGSSRKYALAMLDYMDKVGITKKNGELRTIFKGFDKV